MLTQRLRGHEPTACCAPVFTAVAPPAQLIAHERAARAPLQAGKLAEVTRKLRGALVVAVLTLACY